MAKTKVVRTAPRQGSKGSSGPPKRERGGYFREVITELGKVTWPTRTELIRMTQVVIVTVVIFSLLIGGLDLLLSFPVRRLYGT